jgi:hypothetical protein
VLLPLLKTLKEVNLEYVVVDSRTFVTEHPHAMIRWEHVVSRHVLLVVGVCGGGCCLTRPQPHASKCKLTGERSQAVS